MSAKKNAEDDAALESRLVLIALGLAIIVVIKIVLFSVSAPLLRYWCASR